MNHLLPENGKGEIGKLSNTKMLSVIKQTNELQFYLLLNFSFLSKWLTDYNEIKTFAIHQAKSVTKHNGTPIYF